MSFAYSYFLYCLFIPVLFLVLAYIVSRKRSLQWTLLVAPSLRNILVTPPNKARRLTAFLLGLLGLSCVIIALARPQWGEREVEEFSRGRNLLIALDVSRSMLTRDVAPSRLEQARTTAFDLLDALPQDKIGLIIFSGEATLVVPLTHDHNAIRETLEQANYGWISFGGTNFNQVLELSLKTFSKTEGTHALVILSDGENTELIDTKLAEKAEAQKLIVIAASVGTTNGDTIPDPKSKDGLYRDIRGQLVISKFDSTSLEQLAKATKGQYISLTSGQSLNKMVRDVAQRLDEQEGASATRLVAEERYAPILGLGMAFVILALLISAQWKKSRMVSLLIVLICLLGEFAVAAAEGSEISSNGALSSKENKGKGGGNATKFVINEQLPLEKQAYNAFREGDRAFQEKRFSEAMPAFSHALLAEEAPVQGAAHYNMANALVEQVRSQMSAAKTPNPALPTGQEQSKVAKDKESDLKAQENLLQEAIKHYDDTLKMGVYEKDAQFNKEVAAKLLEMLKQEQNKDQQKQDNKDQQDQENKDKQDQQNKDKQDQQNKDQQNQDNKDQQNQENKDKQDQQNKDQQNQDNKDQQDQENKDKQDQQNKDQQNQDNKDQQDQENKDKQDQQNKDQQNQDNKDQQNQENKDKQDQQNKDQQNQDNKDQQNQENKDKQDQQNQEGQQENPAQQGEQDKKDQQHKDQQEALEMPEPKEGEMTEEEAMRILEERADLEKGNPFPYRRRFSPPRQDW